MKRLLLIATVLSCIALNGCASYNGTCAVTGNGAHFSNTDGAK